MTGYPYEYTAQIKTDDGYFIVFDVDSRINATIDIVDGKQVLAIYGVWVKLTKADAHGNPSREDEYREALTSSDPALRAIGQKIFDQAMSDDLFLDTVMDGEGVEATPIPEPYSVVNHAQTGVMRGRAA